MTSSPTGRRLDGEDEKPKDQRLGISQISAVPATIVRRLNDRRKAVGVAEQPGSELPGPSLSSLHVQVPGGETRESVKTVVGASPHLPKPNVLGSAPLHVNRSHDAVVTLLGQTRGVGKVLTQRFSDMATALNTSAGFHHDTHIPRQQHQPLMQGPDLSPIPSRQPPTMERPSPPSSIFLSGGAPSRDHSHSSTGATLAGFSKPLGLGHAGGVAKAAETIPAQGQLPTKWGFLKDRVKGFVDKDKGGEGAASTTAPKHAETLGRVPIGGAKGWQASPLTTTNMAGILAARRDSLAYPGMSPGRPRSGDTAWSNAIRQTVTPPFAWMGGRKGRAQPPRVQTRLFDMEAVIPEPPAPAAPPRPKGLPITPAPVKSRGAGFRAPAQPFANRGASYRDW